MMMLAITTNFGITGTGTAAGKAFDPRLGFSQYTLTQFNSIFMSTACFVEGDRYGI